MGMLLFSGIAKAQTYTGQVCLQKDAILLFIYLLGAIVFYQKDSLLIIFYLYVYVQNELVQQ